MSPWSDREWIRKPRRGLEYVVARAPVLKWGYWKYAPEYYQWRLQRRIKESVDYKAPLDPLRPLEVNPDEISRFSGRKQARVDRWRSIGEIKEGQWDKRPPEYSDVPDYLKTIFTADRIEETVLCQSLEAHFLEDVPWTETELIERAFRGIREGHTVLQSESKEDALQRCREIDDIYECLATEKYLSQLELRKLRGIGRDRVGYLDLVADEITVDIGRDGNLLFVDGRHRLCLSKILDLDTVPVTVLVRHKKWMKKRGRLYMSSGDDNTHPDLSH